MIIFKLPDLGEGLPEAEIREWYVKVGDEVVTDQPMVSVETAKALVDVPAPYDVVVEKLLISFAVFYILFPPIYVYFLQVFTCVICFCFNIKQIA